MAHLAEPAAVVGSEVLDCMHPTHCLAQASAMREDLAQQSRTASAQQAPGRLVASPAPEPSLALAGKVLLECCVAGLYQHFRDTRFRCVACPSSCP